MNLPHDSRGVSEVIGSVLIFGLVVTMLVIVQLNAVPAMNEQIEFEHSERVVDDFQSLDEQVEYTGSNADAGSVAIEAGVSYPPRMFLLNPPPAFGTLRTTDAGELRLENVEAVDPEVRDYLAPGMAPFETTALVHAADYNEYGAAPETRYENGILYRRTIDGARVADVVIDGGSLVDGRRITLRTLAGQFATSTAGTIPLTVQPVGGPMETVTVRGAGGSAPAVVVPTALSESTWREDVLAAEYDPDGTVDGAYVSAIECVGQPASQATEPCDGALRITFEAGQTYELRMAAVAIDDASDEAAAGYLRALGTPVTSLDSDGTVLEVGLRDRFNTPIAGRDVIWTITAGEASIVTAGETDEAGTASATVTPTGPDPVTVVAAHDANGNGQADDGEAFVVRFDGLAPDDTEGGLEDINPHDKRVVLTATTIDRNVVTATLENRGTERTWTIEEARISFALASGNPTYADVTRTDTGASLGRLYVAADFESVTPVTLGPDEDVTLRFAFDDDIEKSGGQPFDGLVIFTTYQTTDGDAATQTYFISDGTGAP